MKKYTKYFVGGVLLFMTVIACNNDDNLDIPTVEDAVKSTNEDVDAFLENFTINDKELFASGVLLPGINESSVRFIQFDEEGNVPDSQKDNTSGIKLLDLLNEKTATDAGFLNPLVKGRLEVNSEISQDYYYMILRGGEGKTVFKSDPSFLVTQIGSVNNSVTDSKLDVTGIDDRFTAWRSLATGDFEAFDLLRSKMKAGASEDVCYPLQDFDTVESNSGVALMIVPRPLIDPTPSAQSNDVLVYTFSILNTERADFDGDGVLTIDEVAKEVDGDGFKIKLNDDDEVIYLDTDGDGTEDYRDGDDDGDGKATFLELKLDDAIKDLDTSVDADCNGDVSDDFRLSKDWLQKIVEGSDKPAYLDKNKK